MNRRTIEVLCGLGLVVACQGGGVANDFGPGLSDNAPTDPGAPPDPNAPPPNPNDPPFADPTTGTDVCPNVCRELIAACPDEEADYDECVQECRAEIPAQCRDLAISYVRCVARNGCLFDEPDPQTDPNAGPAPVVCEAELVRYIACLGPDPDPPDGEGGAGGI